MTDRETEKKLKILTAIITIRHSIIPNLELEKISHKLGKELMNIVDCDGYAILLIEGSKVKILAERGVLKVLEKKEFSVDMPAIKYTVNTKKSICTGNVLNSTYASCVPSGCAITLFCQVGTKP